MFSATGAVKTDDSVTVGWSTDGGIWIQVVEGDDPQGRGAFIEINDDDSSRLIEALSNKPKTISLNSLIGDCACGGNCNCK